MSISLIFHPSAVAQHKPVSVHEPSVFLSRKHL